MRVHKRNEKNEKKGRKRLYYGEKLQMPTAHILGLYLESLSLYERGTMSEEKM